MKTTKQQCWFVWGKTLYTSQRYVICLQSQSPAVSSNIAMNKNLTCQIIADISVEDLLHGLVSWLLMSLSFLSQEERFLFPIYPFICLCGAVTLTEAQVCKPCFWMQPIGCHGQAKRKGFIVFIRKSSLKMVKSGRQNHCHSWAICPMPSSYWNACQNVCSCNVPLELESKNKNDQWPCKYTWCDKEELKNVMQG